MSLSINYKNTLSFLNESEITMLAPQAFSANDLLHNGSGAGADFLGWVSLPENAKKGLAEISSLAKEIQKNAEVLVVVGIGGSYLGARAVIELFASAFSHAFAKKGAVAVVFAGNNISGAYLNDIIRYLDGKDFYINVISKSGTTTEPAIAFRALKKYAESRYGEQAASRIIATTDAAKGALRTLADEKGYRSFIIPDDVGGRYSVLTPVGLLPIAAAGIDVEALIAGARAMQKITTEKAIEKNPAVLYAILRNALYRKGYTTEILVNYIPRMHYFSEWWKQLYGESEGKDNKGLFPAAVDFTTDLHSLGQYIQEGLRTIFETVLHIGEEANDSTIETDEANLDGLNYLSGRTLHDVNMNALAATVFAHVDGGVPNLVLECDRITADTVGELIYFFEKACGVSGYMLGVNPFDQPGVEAYKKNMFALLGKPGFEEAGATLKERLNNF